MGFGSFGSSERAGRDFVGALVKLFEEQRRLVGCRAKRRQKAHLVHAPLQEEGARRALHGEDCEKGVNRGGNLSRTAGDVLGFHPELGEISSFVHIPRR